MKLLALMALALALHAGANRRCHLHGLDPASARRFAGVPGDELEFRFQRRSFRTRPVLYGRQLHLRHGSDRRGSQYLGLAGIAELVVHRRVRRPSGFHPRPFLQLAISRNRLRGCRATCISRASFPKKFSPVVPCCLCCLTTAPMYCPDCLPTRWTGPFGEPDGRPAQRGWTLRRRQLPECSRARDSTRGLFALIVLGLARRLKESTVCKHPIHSDTI